MRGSVGWRRVSSARIDCVARYVLTRNSCGRAESQKSDLGEQRERLLPQVSQSMRYCGRAELVSRLSTYPLGVQSLRIGPVEAAKVSFADLGSALPFVGVDARANDEQVDHATHDLSCSW